jgi:ribosome-binding protein aMBF1 (putative translation factor)
MDCESCGRHRPSDQVIPTRSTTGEVVMVCGRCRRHFGARPVVTSEFRPATTRQIAVPGRI